MKKIKTKRLLARRKYFSKIHNIASRFPKPYERASDPESYTLSVVTGWRIPKMTDENNKN